MKLTPLRVAVFGTLLVIAWQCLLVAGSAGNWTRLFYAGDRFPPPPYLKERMFQYKGSSGFDGQFYFYIAHDPGDTKGTSRFVDNPPVRWRRILVPGMAWLLSLGQISYVTAAYIAVIWLLTGLGIYVLAALAVAWGYPALWGLSFLLIPAVPVSLERMMTDIAAVTLLLVVVWAVQARNATVAYGALALIPLARETGLAVTAGWMLWHAWKREWKPVAFGAATAIPFVGWAGWVAARYPSDGTAWLGAPFSGILNRLLVWEIYPAPVFSLKLAATLDYVGAIGIAASFAIAIYLFVRGDRSFLVFAAVVYTLGIAVFAKEDMWGEAYSYCRTGGPVAVMLALIGFEQGRWWMTVPMLAASPRIALQLYGVTKVAIEGVLS